MTCDDVRELDLRLCSVPRMSHTLGIGDPVRCWPQVVQLSGARRVRSYSSISGAGSAPTTLAMARMCPRA